MIKMKTHLLHMLYTKRQVLTKLPLEETVPDPDGAT